MEDDVYVEPANPALAIRAVCTSWKFAVDTFLQNQDHHFNIGFTPDDKVQEFSDPIGRKSPGPIHPYMFEVVGKVEKFMAKDYSLDSNPFINRYVVYSERTALGGNNDGRTAFSKLLRLYGSHVWHAELKLFLKIGRKASTEEEESSKRSAYKFVRRCLSFTPNLKTLVIDFRSDCLNMDIRRTNACLEKLLQTNPLPKLEHLQTLRMLYVPNPLEKGLLISNNHVRSLSLNDQVFGE